MPRFATTVVSQSGSNALTPREFIGKPDKIS